MRRNHRKALWSGAVVAGMVAVLLVRGYIHASDHADTPEIYDAPATDLSDVFIFPSPANASNVVLVMNVRPLIPKGQGSSFSFDPAVLYQFKIDRTGDGVEDLVVQATFGPPGSGQPVTIRGPVPPRMTGTRTQFVDANPVDGVINQAFTPRPGMRAFAGVREDPFFFDLERFFMILPDRQTPITKQPVANPNTPQLASWRPPGEAKDFLADFNVLSIVVELPKADLGTGVISVWCTTSV